MIVIGISAFYHDSACAITVDGKLVAAAQEERFTRQRFDAGAPLYAFRYCLDEAGVGPADIDCLAYYEDPVAKLGRQVWMELADPGIAAGKRAMPRLDATYPERQLRDRLGLDCAFQTVQHHQAHAASAFYFSGFTEAALFTADAVGEWTTTSYGAGSPDGIALLHEVSFPDSVGLLYSTITSYLGFTVNSDEYKVMGLASYGRPRYVEQIRQLVDCGTGGAFRLTREYFGFRHGERMFTDRLIELLGFGPRVASGEILTCHQDLASSLQVVTEELLLGELAYLASRSASENICYAGGVALNCVANGRLRRQSPFRNWFIPPAPGDAGSAVGAAMLVNHRLGGTVRKHRMVDACLGPGPGGALVRRVLAASGLAYTDFDGRTEELVADVADRLAAGQVVGWCRGRMEFGPRALGARSILGDPRTAGMRDRINLLVKKREEFRPFAPAVAAERAAEFFDLPVPSPFMVETVPVRPGAALEAVTHVDSSARVQTVDRETNPDFHALLTRFGELTGVPVLLNTSFNVRGEPIVCDALDALMCFVRAGIDVLVIEDLVVEQKAIPDTWRYFVAQAAELYGWLPTTGDSYTFFI